jgi:UDP-N-acetylmuramate dehydrogenase
VAKYNEIFKELKRIKSAKVLRDEPLSRHTTFKIGGPADILVIPKDLDALREVLSATQGIKKYIIGNGSNLLIPDKGLEGIVIKVSGGMNDFECEGRHVTVGAGTLIQPLLRKLAGAALSGLEFAAGVPAAVGGAVVMNLGAFGHDIGRLIEYADIISAAGKDIKLSRSDLGFSYRSSRIDECIVISAKLRLSHKRKETIWRNMEQIMIKRKETQPWAVPGAGSIFKNPKDIPAGKLIDMAGLKGLRIGGAEISKKHANFIINLGDAKESDVKAIIKKVRTVVKEKFRVKLELELVDSGNLIVLS